MCGIIGYIGQEPISESALKILLLKAMPRGRRATGIATRKKIIKRACSADEFIRRDLPTDKVMLGHTRFPTTGANTDDNAHPFTTNGITGVHNGAISNFHTLKRAEGTERMKVDSEIIWHLISKYGIEEAHQKMYGGYALAWIDKKEPDKLFLFRHSNPTYIGRRDGAVYFGSSSAYLSYLGCEDVLSTEEDFLYTFNTEGELEDKVAIPSVVKEDNREKQKEEGGKSEGGTMSDALKAYYTACNAPSAAEFIYSESGYGTWHWHPDEDDPYFLRVELVHPNLHYLSGIEEYHLDDEESVNKLATNCPEIFNLTKIQNLIEE